MSIETALKSAIATIPDCIAAGYVDMETGMLLGTNTSDPDAADAYLDSLAIAVANLFQGRGVKAFEELLRSSGTEEAEYPGFGEIAVFSNDRLNIFSADPGISRSCGLLHLQQQRQCRVGADKIASQPGAGCSRSVDGTRGGHAMMDTDILEMLDDIGRSAVARLNPAVTIPGETAQVRRDKVLNTIRGTILPRRLEFTAANGVCLAIEVNSSRVTDVFRVHAGIAPDFETESSEELAAKLAGLVSDIASAPAPLELVSLQPDTALEADDVGITFSEIEAACESIELTADPVISIVADRSADEDETAAEPSAEGFGQPFLRRC